MLISEKGIIIKISVKAIRDQGRNTKGVRLMRIPEGDRIVSIVKVIEEEDSVDEESVEQVDNEAISE